MIKNIVFDVGNVIWKGNSKSIINYIKIDNLEDKENISTFFEGFRLMDLDEETIRETIAFPMTAGGSDALMGAPGDVTELQLREAHIKIR